MEKPIIATNLDGLLIEHEAFTEPHRNWFERAIKKTGDESLRKWIGADPYFPGVSIAMEQIMPNTTPEQRTAQARRWYQEDVVRYIQEHPKVIKKVNVTKLRDLKSGFRLVLVTTNTEEYINRILRASKLQGIYDDIIASKAEREPSNEDLITELIKKYGKPKYYITGKPEEKTIARFRKLRVKIINEEEIDKLSP